MGTLSRYSVAHGKELLFRLVQSCTLASWRTTSYVPRPRLSLMATERWRSWRSITLCEAAKFANSAANHRISVLDAARPGASMPPPLIASFYILLAWSQSTRHRRLYRCSCGIVKYCDSVAYWVTSFAFTPGQTTVAADKVQTKLA